MNSAFSEQILEDKLSKLNNTQQCIETLSHWCIFHRKNAEQVVQTWDKQFHGLEKEKKIPFLYLANDILQNSKRNGNEFVGEFWKFLPAALKDVVENGDDHGKNVVSRLVDIWEERRVFGSRARGLRDLMLGKEPLLALELNKKRSRSSIKIVKRDSRSMRIKLYNGGTAEKIVSALHTVLSEQSDENTNLQKCIASIRRVGKMEKDVDSAASKVGDPRRETLANELQEEEAALKQCIGKLKVVEANRVILASHLKEALLEQESELEKVGTQIQLAEAMINEAANMRSRLNNELVTVSSKSPSSSESLKPHSNGQATSTPKKSAAAIAAEVADRLAASTRSQQIMTSVLSSFAAEEAKNAGLTYSSSSSLSKAPPDIRVSAEKPLPVSAAGFVPVQPMVVSTAHQPQAIPVQQTPALYNQYNLYPAPAQQYLQPSGGVMIGMPYAYNAIPTQQPPPPPPQIINLPRPSPLTLQQPLLPPPPPSMAISPQLMAMNQQLMPVNQAPPMQFALQQSAPPPAFGPLQPPGMAFYHPQTQ